MRDYILAGTIGTVLALLTMQLQHEAEVYAPKVQHWCVFQAGSTIRQIPVDSPDQCVLPVPNKMIEKEWQV